MSASATLPAAAATRVEFISQIHPASPTELDPRPTAGIEPAYLRRYVRALEEADFDYTLLPYGSTGADSMVLATAVSQMAERLRTIVALRPNTVFPLVAAQQLATLDQLNEGRTLVHLISGGSTAEQARQGDYLDKGERYARTEEFLSLLRRAWTEREPFSHHGEYYRFDDFGPGLRTHSGAALPISIGGQSDSAFAVGAAHADVFSFWGEPLAAFADQLQRLDALTVAAGRSRPRIWVTFRPILGTTEERAWTKAQDYAERIGRTFQTGRYFQRGFSRGAAPENVGSRRALEFADRREVYDRALWTRTAAVTNGSGAATALVGTPETVAAAILDYVDLGASLVSIRGYDNLNDIVEYGRTLIPLVRQELAHRAATGSRGTLQADHPGKLGTSV